jgi:hypothetical protein
MQEVPNLRQYVYALVRCQVNSNMAQVREKLEERAKEGYRVIAMAGADLYIWWTLEKELTPPEPYR